MKKPECYIYLFFHMLLGLVVLLLSDKLRLPSWMNQSVVTFVAFLFINLNYVSFLRLTVIKEYWAPFKAWYMLPAILAGACIATLPNALALCFGVLKQADITYNFASFSSVIITFFIVGWEELWFRSVILNYCNRYLSTIHISVVMGVLFMLVHVLNPKMHLLYTGPALFFAGALLTATYFYYRSIWVPLGLHYGNNFISEMIRPATESHLFFGGNGYLSAIILAALFLAFAYKLKRQKTAF